MSAFSAVKAVDTLADALADAAALRASDVVPALAPLFYSLSAGVTVAVTGDGFAHLAERVAGRGWVVA